MTGNQRVFWVRNQLILWATDHCLDMRHHHLVRNRNGNMVIFSFRKALEYTGTDYSRGVYMHVYVEEGYALLI